MKAHLAALAVVVLVVRWLAVTRLPLPLTGTGAVVTVPALVVVVLAAVAVAAGLAVLFVRRARAERATAAAWYARHAVVTRPGWGGVS